MPDYITSDHFRKALSKKPRQMQVAVLKTIAQLAANPRHQGLQTHRVHGTPGVFEAYIDKGNRVTFHWEGDLIVFRNNCNHDILKRRP